MISVGDVTFQMRALDSFANNLTAVTNGFSTLYERSIRINEIKEVFDMKPIIEDGKIKLSKQLETQKKDLMRMP